MGARARSAPFTVAVGLQFVIYNQQDDEKAKLVGCRYR